MKGEEEQKLQVKTQREREREDSDKQATRVERLKTTMLLNV